MLAATIPRLLIAEDNAGVRDALYTILLRHRMTVVAAACNGVEAVALYREHRPDMVLMDISMPEMDGVTATKSIVAEFPQAKVIVLTFYDDKTIASLEAGAVAVVLKDAPTSILIEAIQWVFGLLQREQMEQVED